LPSNGCCSPLSQPPPSKTRPQEAELQAAVDKAVEAEARASEVEMRMKEAKVLRLALLVVAGWVGGWVGAGALYRVSAV